MLAKGIKASRLMANATGMASTERKSSCSSGERSARRGAEGGRNQQPPGAASALLLSTQQASNVRPSEGPLSAQGTTLPSRSRRDPTLRVRHVKPEANPLQQTSGSPQTSSGFATSDGGRGRGRAVPCPTPRPYPRQAATKVSKTPCASGEYALQDSSRTRETTGSRIFLCWESRRGARGNMGKPAV